MPAKQVGGVAKVGKKYRASWYGPEVVIGADGKPHPKRHTKSDFTTKTDARDFVKAQVERVEAARNSGVPEGQRPTTMDALLDLFLELHADGIITGRKPDPATVARITQQFKHPRKAFGNRNPDSILEAEAKRWRLGLPDGSRHDVFRSTRQAVSWGHKKGYIGRDWTAGISNPKPTQDERKAVHPFESWDEIEAIADELDPRYRAIPILGAGTGLRPEEIFGLHRADVDWDGRRLYVQRRFTQGVLKEKTKTQSGREVPFGTKVADALKAMPIRIETKILFPAPLGGYIDSDAWRYREWTPALRAAGIEHRRINDLRHTYASWSLAADPPVPIGKLAKMMGTSVEMIETTYHRWLNADNERYATALDNYGTTAVNS